MYVDMYVCMYICMYAELDKETKEYKTLSLSLSLSHTHTHTMYVCMYVSRTRQGDERIQSTGRGRGHQRELPSVPR
jgi:hypothetical protein